MIEVKDLAGNPLEVGDMVCLASGALPDQFRHYATCIKRIEADVGPFGFPIYWLVCDNGGSFAPKAVRLILSGADYLPASWAQIQCNVGWRPRICY